MMATVISNSTRVKPRWSDEREAGSGKREADGIINAF